MRRLAAIAAIASLPFVLGAATCDQRVHQACSAVIGAAHTAQELAPILARVFHVPEGKAKLWADRLFTGELTATALCAIVDPAPPIATPGA